MNLPNKQRGFIQFVGLALGAASLFAVVKPVAHRNQLEQHSYKPTE